MEATRYGAIRIQVLTTVIDRTVLERISAVTLFRNQREQYIQCPVRRTIESRVAITTVCIVLILTATMAVRTEAMEVRIGQATVEAEFHLASAFKRIEIG